MIEQAIRALESLGPMGALAYVPFYFLGSLLFLPNPFLVIAAGVLFDPLVGFALASFSSLFTATVVFLLGRYWSRGWILKKAAGSHKIQAVDDAVGKRGWKMVLLLRFTAILPFSVMNYALGLSKVRLKHFVLASWFGMMPGILLYVYLGAIMGKMAFKTGRVQTGVEWIFLAFGFIMTCGMGVYATSVVKKVLKEGDPK